MSRVGIFLISNFVDTPIIYGKNVTLSFYIIAICITGQQVNLLRCTTKYRAKRHYTSIVVAKYKWSLLCEDVDFSFAILDILARHGKVVQKNQ
jgi:hypothetical protein